ncbi:DNA-directed DNA polymerase [Marivirga tractuosa]|uniref:DNA polymerase III subunit alpha n=1 Tax=Marivirga tractuosa (strain ATCC 23168 / DSM 4126 / NBRC 15989 / NCIMB 1408 / VKM B-1430 / H-43) TaxID=643867 RepID=E4TLQ2_MARTH|nr:DNA polymerase III subunit alpha [Marivirga tractuosa]ADR23331.1 DNA polymerase III, alpha subunit [Marivirga tractuosa DSM 4126]BDD15995.1 DNA-directed DNA polymerase [Marivirga tractuosa]
MYLIYDTETTGLPKNYNAPLSDADNWPRCVQIAWQLHGANGELLDAQNHIIKPEGFDIPYNAEKVHGISTERAQKEGKPLIEVLEAFKTILEKTDVVVGHNISFDISIMGAEMLRKELSETVLTEKPIIDTKEAGTDFCKIPGGRGGKYKWPTLTELHKKLFGQDFADAHDAAYDVDATAKCFFGLITEKAVKPLGETPIEAINYEPPKLDAANFATSSKNEEKAASDALKQAKNADISELSDTNFVHLHCHTQFSILQSTTEIPSMVNKAKEMGMPAIAMTDHGNMMGAYNFVRDANKAGIKPIVGCEYFLTQDRNNKKNKDDGFQTVLLAKNKAGYHNLAKLSSIAFVEGFYYVPRIDREALVQYKENIIATTGGLWGEVPFLILNAGEAQAEEAFLWWKEQFGDDFYVELNQHGVPEEQKVNEVLLKFAKKYDVKYFAANNTYYTNKEDAEAQDILLCVKDGETTGEQGKPKKYVGKRGREYRFGLPNDEFYIKSPDEMKKLFADYPEAIACTAEIAEKIEGFELARDVLLPKYDIPQEFIDPKDAENGGNRGENAYLRHITYEGAKKRYPEITAEIKERLDFELETIERTGYPGYFLIVQDFTTAAREMGVSVGPGRGSAAGSAVAYCTAITNIDPIKYDLLFERFLNPDRVSLPDIDIDFDDHGRQKVIDYVIEKYGANQVAQITTYGTMAAKSAIRDTARVMELPLMDADRIAKLVPDIKLKALFDLASDKKKLSAKLKNNGEAISKAEELLNLAKANDASAKVINQARVLEGSVRNTGIHACGVIITPDDITKFVPVALAKDSDMYCTQFDNAVVENAGLLKMDFLGLKTLTLIKDAVRIVEERHGVKLDPDEFPIDDPKTYELFQKGETVGIFQYESPGMQKYLRDLKPTEFSDLIAMNALYRPGPLEYIPNFVKRKNGLEEISYDLPEMEEYLQETYGITVYQEQVMLLSQKLAGFTKGEADVLRKAMGKKIFALLEELKPKFINQGAEKGHPKDVLEKIWKDWEAFAAYAFNKSHSTCYAWVAYQTAYLKAHYPAEYMASVLSNNMGQITDVTFFMEECKRAGIEVLGPDVNESNSGFTVNDNGQIRFGLAAIKGAGSAAVESIIQERKSNGQYKDIFDFAERIPLKSVNKKTFESLAMAGGFDCFKEYHRKQFLASDNGEGTLIEKIIKYAQKLQHEKDSAQTSLFGGEGGVAIPPPRVAEMEPYSELEKLNIEKEVVGLFISGHPLDEYRFEMESFCNTQVSELNDIESLASKNEIKVGGIVTAVAHRQTKTGKPFGTLTLEDYGGSFTFFMFGDDYLANKQFYENGWFIFISGRVGKKPWGDQALEFKISKVELLSELRDKRTKSLAIMLDLNAITEDLIVELDNLCQTFKGECEVKLELQDKVNGYKVETKSRKYKVNPSNELIEGLNRIPDLNYRILT